MVQLSIDVHIPNDPVYQPDGASRIIRLELTKLIREALESGRNIAGTFTPVGATGDLRGNIVTRPGQMGPVTYQGRVVWNTVYAQTVDQGGPPRIVPISRLRAWASAVLGDASAAGAIQKAIQRRGTPSPAHPKPGLGMSDRLVEKWTPRVEKLLNETCRVIALKLNR